MRSLSPFCWRRRVAMRDVDAWGVVWHGNYLVYCDEARSELLRAFDLAPGTFMARGFVAPVIDASCRYLAPARYDEEIDVHVRVRPVRGTRLLFEFKVARASDEQELARVSTTLVLTRVNGDLVYLMPEEVKEGVARLLAAQAALEAEKPVAEGRQP